jgi:para-nitrobenzyl esterase
MTQHTRRRVLHAGIATAALGLATRSVAANTKPQPAPGDIVIDTPSGKLRGKSGIGSYFLGVPYAGSIAGRRFREAEPMAAWAGVRDALYPAPKCPQDSDTGPALLASYKTPGEMLEDCLTLNIWTRDPSPARKRPVMVWLHGGGFEGGGSGSSSWYDGANLAQRGDVVIVTVTHRLNVFGYLHLADVAPQIKSDANVGQTDIVMALRWIRKNIEAFGGDPACVTLFGASGGGRKGSLLMAMPEARGLFHRVIAQSGPILRAQTREEAAENARAFLKQLNIAPADAAALEQLPAAALVAAREALFVSAPNVSYGPVVDGVTLPVHPSDPAPPSEAAAIPMLIGCTGTETTLLMPQEENFRLDEAAMRKKLEAHMPSAQVIHAVEALRAEEGPLSPSDVFFRITSDLRMRNRSIEQATRKAAQTAPVYMYVTEWKTPIDGGKWRSPHVVDLPLIFDNVSLAPSMLGYEHEYGGSARTMAARMADAWIAFARTGNPGTSALPAWPRYNEATRATMRFDNECRIVNDPHRDLRRIIA